VTWTRLDDGWTDLPLFESLPFETRWHYLALLQFCSRTSRYDGIVRGSDARRCSDVPDPVAALMTLHSVGLVVTDERGYRLPFIDQHVPPPYMRDEERKAGQRDRKRRERRHKIGDHALCDPEHCAGGPAVPRDMSRDAGTGRDGTGRGVGNEGEQQKLPNDPACYSCKTSNPAGAAVCGWCRNHIHPDGSARSQEEAIHG